jgi:hypothetical protein
VREDVTDAALVRRVASDDADALRALYDQYGAIVFGMAQRLLGDRHLAEECTQDVFVAVWRNAHSYDEDRAQVTTWLFTIARIGLSISHVGARPDPSTLTRTSGRPTRRPTLPTSLSPPITPPESPRRWPSSLTFNVRR